METKKLFLIFAMVLYIVSCSENYTDEQLAYINEVKIKRAEKDEWMKNNPQSPFNHKEKVEFSPLKYYEPNFDFIFRSKLYEFENKDTVSIFGTKGEKRKSVKYGYFILNYNNKDYKLNLYESRMKGDTYYSIWFTDRTSGKDTYGVGRYLNFKKSPDKDYVYTIDFNWSYNPYCAYNKAYSCAIPTKEDYLDFPVEAGEKKFHD